MEKKHIRSGAPFVVGAAGVLGFSLLFGLGGLGSYILAAVVFMLFYKGAKKRFPDREIVVERAPASGDSACDAMILEGRESLKQIRTLNDQIADPALSARIDSIENSCRAILRRLEEQPAMLSSLRTFLRYYLPTTRKILDNRALIEQRGTMDDENARAVCERTDRLLPEIRRAFQKQLDALNEHNYLDVEVEMDVLEGMMKGDGLAGGASAAATQTK